MHPVFATAREIAGESLAILQPILSPSWAQPARPASRSGGRRRGAGGAKVVVARVHGVGGAFL